MNIPPGYLTVPQFAKKHGLPESTVRYQVNHGLLDHLHHAIYIPIIKATTKPAGRAVNAKKLRPPQVGRKLGT